MCKKNIFHLKENPFKNFVNNSVLQSVNIQSLVLLSKRSLVLLRVIVIESSVYIRNECDKIQKPCPSLENGKRNITYR